MKIAIYPGSFNPFHEGHADIVSQALKVFDHVRILQCYNPNKSIAEYDLTKGVGKFIDSGPNGKVSIDHCNWLLRDYVDTNPNALQLDEKPCAIIRGLRNGQDLEGDRAWQYWNQDLGIKIPFMYFICRRELIHYSSSAIREISKVTGKDYDNYAVSLS